MLKMMAFAAFSYALLSSAPNKYALRDHYRYLKLYNLINEALRFYNRLYLLNVLFVENPKVLNYKKLTAAQASIILYYEI